MYEYKAVVTHVHDGDTVTLDVDLGFGTWRRDMNIRMVGINAPEIRTADPAGYAARDYLRALIPDGKLILLRSLKDLADKYGGRWLGTLYSPPLFGADGQLVDAGTNLNELMVSSGHAVVYNP